MRRRHGFTLIELVAILAIFGIVSIYVGRILLVNERAYHTVEGTSQSQQNLRVFAELIEDNLRHAGFMVSLEASVCGVDDDTGPDMLYLSDAEAIDPGNDFDPYPGARISGATNVSGTQTLTLDSLVIEPSPPNRPAYDTDGNGTPDSDFREKAGVIVADLMDPDRGTACGKVTNVDLVNGRITVEFVTSLETPDPASADLVAVPANEYRVNGTQLLWNGKVLADGVEDLQVAYIFDLNGNNVIDAGETRGDGSGANDYDSAELDASKLREIEASVVARSRLPDPTFVGRRQAFQNRQPPATTDNFRRRALETRIRLRNLVARVET